MAAAGATNTPAVAETPAIKGLNKTKASIECSADAAQAATKALKEADKLMHASVKKMALKAPSSAMKHDDVNAAVSAANAALERVQATVKTLTEHSDGVRAAIQEHAAAIKAAKKVVDKTAASVKKAEAAPVKTKPRTKKEPEAAASAASDEDVAAAKKAAAKAKREASKAAKAAAKAAEEAEQLAAGAAAAEEVKPKAARTGGKKRGRAAAAAAADDAESKPATKRRPTNKYHTMTVDYAYPASDEDKVMTCSFDTKNRFAYTFHMCDGFSRDVWNTVEPMTLKEARASFKALRSEYADHDINVLQHKEESHADKQSATA